MNVSDIIALAALMVAVIGIPLTFILARRSHLRPELRSVIDFDQILKADDNLFDRGLSMKLGDHEIESICRSRIAIWNNHGDPIRKADIVTGDPLRIQLAEDDEVLQARVLYVSRKHIAFAAELDTSNFSAIRISFDFLDADDGGIIEIIHQKPNRPTIGGTIQGCDIRKPKSADLSAKALTAFLMPSAVRRFWAYTPRGVKRSYVYLSGMLIAFAALFVTFVERENAPNRLINAKHYNLQSLYGQVRFARAVSNLGAFNSSNVITEAGFAVVIVTLVSVMVAGFIMGNRRRFAPSIMACRLITGDESIGTTNKVE